MRERKYIKFRVDMYEDTKFKIIDRMPERDVIHYIWTRIVALAAKVNLEGNLYMSKTIPYTIETLAIEFNRDEKQVKLALDTFIELEMVEVTKENIYKVKNFAKHQNQNIKVKSRDIEEETKKEETHLKREESKINVNIENQKLENKEKETDNNSNEKQDYKEENIKNNINDRNGDLEVIFTNIHQSDNLTDKVNKNPQGDSLLVMKKSKRSSKRKRKDMDIEVINEEANDDSIVRIYEGDEINLQKYGVVVGEWTF